MSSDISEHRKNLLEELAVAGRENSNAAVMFHSAAGERMGLGLTEEKAIDLLERHGPLSAGEIVRHTGLAPASVSGLIDRLAAKGFVRRVRDPGDRRKVIVEIDYSHVAQFAPLFEDMGKGMMSLFADYSDDELALILGFLRRATEIQTAATAALQEDGPKPHRT
ncbi:MarR family transcriptional regulator [Spongiactinospora sp. TRM90649]|uniref:MarR family winged helix-turn-helix transcriptional regulator n=1 Tax=Spongiactinospora sp. TRM90649 TaxID=3031114 RepID=UPI0023F6C80B|nr:MarR family transcriptional regulator [Spongiactinospora sp. TRM90649]MDF5752910.1 MarR family transcriptional regulator [Spongiactinospora sp. TRM90649]